MSDNKESLSAFAEKSQKSLSEFNQILGRTILVSPNEEQYELLLKRLKQQLGEGRGEVILEIGGSEDGADAGLSDDEMDAAVATLQSLATSLDCSCVKLRDRKDQRGIVAQFLIRRLLDQSDFLEIRVAVVGNVDAGKSTLLGVLTHGDLDNGRGHARQKLFRHKHEMESGRTSSVGNDILGFDGEGNVVNKPEHGSLDWVKICEKSSKVITFIDLAGHERYLKTTVFGMTGHAPDFGMLMIGANAGIIGMTKEHLGLALALSVPVFVVVTKIDMCPTNVLQENLKMLVRILKSPGCRKVPVMVKTTDNVVLSATNFVSERLCPIFQVSNVTGENLDLLKTFLNLLTTRMEYKENEPAEFQIDDSYSVPGVGTVVSGTTLKGVIKLNDTLMLGPDPLGHFQPIPVKSIHRKRMAVREVRAGQTASFALKKIKRSQIRKGMVMVCPSLNPQACWEFEGEILVLHHPTTISSRYQAMVHCGSIRQTASIMSMSQECLRTGDKALIHFRFIKYPEYIVPGQRMVFREGRTKAVGNVVNIFTHTPVSQIGTKSKTSKQQQRYNTPQQSVGKTANHNASQNLQQPKVVVQNKCEYINCEKSERTHPGLKLFPFPKDQRYKKWIVNSGNHIMRNLPLDQLHRKYICSDHFEDSSYSDAAKTKLRRDAHPVPHKIKKTEKVLPQSKEKNNNLDKKTSTPIVDVKLEVNKPNSDAAALKTRQILFDILRKCKTGYNSQLFTQIKCKVDAMSNEEKYCSLMFDEITIDGKLEYSALLDQIEGFEDFGPFGKLNETGKEVMLFMAQGIYSDWKMPVAYFVSSSGIKTHLLSKIILETVKKVLQTGLKLVSIVSDQGHNNVPATKRLGVSTETPYFQVGTKRVYAIFDVPNLFKSIKNNFIGADLIYKENIVSFKDVIETCSVDKQNGNKLKLTESHLNPNYVEKFQIPLALQTFSNTVATCMRVFVAENKLKSNTAGNTAEFIKDLNDLFDCLNSRRCDDKDDMYKRPLSKSNPQIINKLKDAKEWIRKLYKMAETGVKAPRSFSGLIQTINAILMIYGEQEALGFNYLSTVKFNIDTLQEFSASFNRDNATKTVRIFREKFIMEVTNNLLQLSNVSNCSSSTNFENNEFAPLETLLPINIFPDVEDLVLYFSAYLVKICLEKFGCERCKKMLQGAGSLNDKTLLSMLCRSYGLNENSVGDLQKPTEDFLKYTERSEKIFKKVCQDKMRKSGISEHISREIVSVLSSTLDMAQCQAHLEYITKEFVVRRLHIECCMLNEKLENKLFST